MKNTVELLTADKYEQYDRLLRSLDHSLVYSSLEYRRFLESLLPESESRYLCALQEGQVVGALPAFLHRNRQLGNVLNSLPFFGSNGGVVVSPDAGDRLQVQCDLIEAFDRLAREESVVTSTIISNPLNPEAEFYDRFSQATLHDERIGQITPLPELAPEETLAERLLHRFDSMPRRAVRKAQKSGLEVERTDSLAAFDALATIHRRNMEAIGGRVKSARVFELLRSEFACPGDYTLYVARLEGRIVAALLVFFFHRTADYFIPATEAEYRSLQPLSLLIFEAMQDAVRRGCRYWNWGGTWLNQTGVYDFKRRWGTRDCPYRYYVREYEGAARLRRCSESRIRAEYPDFYVLPFRALEETPTEEPT
jgi:CelD/BcsL family acetyltransferase involved in cellulose biosynthesis